MNVTTVLEGKIVLFIASAKMTEGEEGISTPAFMGNSPTISHSFLALSTQLVSSPSRDLKHGVSPNKFSSYCFRLMGIKRIKKQGEFKILLYNPSGGNLLKQSRI